MSYDCSVNYAFQQNAIPVVKELRLRNDATSRKGVTIRLATEPAFAAPVEIRVQALDAGGEFRVAPLDLRLSHDFLAGLNEKVAGWLKLEAIEDTAVICSRTAPISLLARNEWCGLVSLPEILAAFVLPNDPAVMTILGRASEILREATGRAALNGYQDRSRKRAWEQLAAIYKSIAELGIRYIAPPASFEHTGQKVRFPSDIVTQRFGTCLDLSLLFAACCEQAGLRPFVFMHEGHAYTGCWLEDRSLPEPAADDLQHVRKLAADELITVFETTVVASESPGTLGDAELLARDHLRTALPFRLALDVHRARLARIHPLPVPGQTSAPADPAAGDAHAPGSGPGIGSRDFADAVTSAAAGPVRAATRIDQWKSRLLDLSLRNRLLNFRETNSTIRLLSAAPAHVEDELAAERELFLRPKPKLMGEEDPRSTIAYTRQQRTDALAAHLRDELQHGRIHTNLDEAEHSRRLTELYRAARNAIDENGTNTLFAAVGFLEWRETEHSDRVFRAPLLLVPVELRRKSVLEGFSLRRIDEETRLNVTLMEMLRQRFRKEIAGLDPLPEDAHGVDVPRVFGLFRDAVRDLTGWEVKEEIWLGQFSFTKFLLWKDLADRLDALTQNRVVRHLVHEAGTPYPNPPDDIRPPRLDDQFHPCDVFCPRSADSSQLAAVLAAAAGQDFVLEGPPGTGKSQTITNIIAHCLAHGKRVLFVAEKRAALDVVHRRLREEGLEPFCLELHSNKTGKGDVLAQFDRSLKFVAEDGGADWEHRTTELGRLRTVLNDYVRALHRRAACGLSAHHCLDHLLPRQSEPTVRFDAWPAILETSAETLDRARQLSRQLQERSRPLAPLAGHPLAPLACEDWSPAWAERGVERVRKLGACAQGAEEAARELCTWLQSPAFAASRDHLVKLRSLVDSLLAPEPVGPAFATTPWPRLAADLETWIALAEERAALRLRLRGYDESRLLALDLDSLRAKWNSARQAWFLVKWLRIGGIRRQLRTARSDGDRPAVETIDVVLADASRLRAVDAEFAGAAAAAQACLGEIWARGEPSADAMRRARAWGEALHARLLAVVGDDIAWLGRLRQLVSSLFAEGPSAYAAGTGVGSRLTRYREAFDAFETTLDAFVADVRLRRGCLDAAADYLQAAQALVQRLPAGWPRIREWCSWQKVRREAHDLGLAPIIEWLEVDDGGTLDLPALFERSFRRALLFAIVERESPLREFFGREHDERIERFRELDENIAALSRQLIRSRLAAAIPRDQPIDDVPKAEIGLLRRELAKRGRHIPVRRLLAGMPKLLPRLKPCVLMSPLSVAQYLEPSHEMFDVVIFDEASQIPVWDAIGAIARGRQLIVVGDPKQLPPTNFFNSAGDDDDDGDTPAEHKDLESVLDELMSHQLRHRRLQWHYRSRHESLIAFSNRQYYDNDLLTFPSADSEHGGIRFRHLPDARYDKGKSRTNRREAEVLVAELVERLRRPGGPARSYGVVTFSQAQQELVENLLDEERRRHPEIEPHFGDEPPVEGEPVFVKNLENVQGDERDVILFSICYGPDETGRVSMNFGPLNRDGGERRLNVAVTRAKHEVVVFSGLRGDQIDLTRTRARGVRDLKYFLDYAERGPKALAAVSLPAGDEADSEFERMVADRIRAAGYEVHHQVGCSGYRIDLAVVDPRAPGRYALGVECDGATYHRAATARDRDKLRQAVLESLGWKLHRIWSTDWWHDAEAEMAKLKAAIDAVTKGGHMGRG